MFKTDAELPTNFLASGWRAIEYREVSYRACDRERIEERNRSANAIALAERKRKERAVAEEAARFAKQVHRPRFNVSRVFVYLAVVLVTPPAGCRVGVEVCSHEVFEERGTDVAGGLQWAFYALVGTLSGLAIAVVICLLLRRFLPRTRQ